MNKGSAVSEADDCINHFHEDSDEKDYDDRFDFDCWYFWIQKTIAESNIGYLFDTDLLF